VIERCPVSCGIICRLNVYSILFNLNLHKAGCGSRWFRDNICTLHVVCFMCAGIQRGALAVVEAVIAALF
jgi:hypothetical protein